MKQANVRALLAALAPAIVFGIASASANAQTDDADREETVEATEAAEAADNGEDDEVVETHKESEEAIEESGRSPEEVETTDDSARDQSQATEADRASKPEQGYHAGELIGHDVTNRSDEESIGEVKDLVIDQNGQIVAVVVRTGGMLGIGKKDIAIAWDQVERVMDGDEFSLHVDMDEEALERTPEYAEN